MNINDLKLELANLKQRYSAELYTMAERVHDERVRADHDKFTDHAAFNMAATCQNLAVLAGKIEQTANVIRWMGEAR